MNILIFLVSVFFYFIFYFFYIATSWKSFFWYNFSSDIYFSSLSGNLIIESIFFIILGVFLYMYFSDFSLQKREEFFIKKKEKVKYDFFNKENISDFFIVFFKSYLYYIGLILSYLSIFFIFKSYEFESFSYFIVIVNLIVLSWFFISNKFFVFRDFIKINTIIFSLYYIFLYSINFITYNLNFFILDLLNSILILFSFILTFYNDKKILKKSKIDSSLLYYFFMFIFLLLSYFSWILINKEFTELSIFSIIIFVWIFLNILTYFILTKLQIFKNNIIDLRITSFVLSYFSSLFLIIYISISDLSIMALLSILYFIIFNFLIHNKFQNYISFFTSNILIVYVLYFMYYKIFYLSDDWLIFLVLSLFVSLDAIILTYFYKFKYNFDYYFFHVFSYIINFLSIIFYLLFFKIDLFTLWIIFFIESIYLLLSFYKLRQIKNSETKFVW